MFDGLKEKLNSFRKDVEETAEEKAEEADVEEAVDAEAAAEADAAAESEPEAEADAAADPGAETDVDAASTDVEADPTDVDTDASPTETDDVGDESDDAVATETDATASTESLVDEEVDEAGGAAAEPAEAVGIRSERDTDPDAIDASEDEADDESTVSRFKRAKAFATGRIIIEEEDLEEPLWALEMALLESDVEMNVAERILETIREKMIGESRKQVDTTAELVEEALHDALLDVISVGQFDFEERIQQADKPVVVIFTGVNGVGKTTSIAKMSEYLESCGLSSVMANGDTYRAGANEQIRKHAENLDRKLITHEQGGDPAAVIYDAVEYAEAHDVDVVLGDTAGRLHTSNDLMAQLEKINRVVDPDMTLFVDEAVAGQDAVQRAKKFDEAAEIDGAILTKADADSQGGAAISIAYVTGKPILFLGTGQGYDDLERFDPEALVSSLLADEE
ncbi:fused signal recognition particle receptor [Halogranum amylolyticum]|uniref:Signal recognition particle receptor FtsY n=1 Tax=Halogranum amylolyticum TaxID=660520 RepID=A0A1H8QUW2_9EURY|nr:signal recognition particle-docking protein FtsY [Halogranum amylolyticum]SEO58080.1 fused signal recognition particle receptor [Halogranum amylolyticum]